MSETLVVNASPLILLARIRRLELRPAEYVERQIRVTPYPTEDIGWVTEQVGPNVLLFNTDYPHVEGGRRPYERFERFLGDASDEDVTGRVVECVRQGGVDHRAQELGL